MKFKNDIEAQAGFKDAGGDLGVAGQLLSSTGTETNWIDQSTIASGSAEVVEVPVKNLQGSALTKGDPVYISGSVGASGILEVQLADAGNAAKMPAVGLLKQDLAANAQGFAVVTGKLRNLITSPIDGVTPNPNTVIYVKSGGSTGAALTTVKPGGSTNFIQNVGKVGRVSTSSDGTLVVSSILRSNDVPNLPLGRLFVGTSANTSLTSDVVYIDDANDRVGIGTTSPTQKLQLGEVSSGGASTTPDTITLGRTFSSVAGQHLKLRIYEDAVNVGGLGVSSNKLDYAVWSTAADHVFYAGGNELMRIKGNGNVGIGTTSPTGKLNVNQENNISTVTISRGGANLVAGTALGNIIFPADYNGTPTDYASIDAYANASSAVRGSLDFKVKSTSGILLTGMTVYGTNSGANVGIGTTSPGYKLDVNGSAQIKDYIRITNTGGAQRILLGNQDSAGVNNPSIIFAANGNTHIGGGNSWSGNGGTLDYTATFTDAGNVGIGTTGPIAKLHVNATNVLGGSSGDFTILSTLQNSGGSGGNNLYENNWSYRTATGTDWPTWSLWNGISVDASFVTPTTSLTWHWREPNAGKHHFGNGGTNVMTIGPSNVGIGTTSPGAKLNIVHTASTTIPALQVASSASLASNDIVRFQINGLTNGFRMFQDASSVLNYTFQDGNVGIGTTSPATALDVNGTISVGGSPIASFSGNYNRISRPNGTVGIYLGNATDAGNYYDNTTHYFRSSGGSSTYAIINYLGNVGIGTTSPDSKLEVEDGSIRTTTLNSFSNLISGRAGVPSADGYNLGGLLFQAYRTGTTYATGAAIYAYADGAAWTSSSVPSYLSFHTAKGGETNATERMVINSIGYVGIGTDSPGQKLQVNGIGEFAGALRITETGTSQNILIGNQDSGGTNTPAMINGVNGSLRFGKGNSWSGEGGTFTETMRVDSSGSVGIGITSPSKTLEVAGTGIKLVNAANTHTHLLLDTATYDYKLGDISTSGGAYMQITSSTNQTFIYNSDLILSDGQKITITRSNPADPSCIYVDNTYTSFGTTYNIDSDVSSTLGSRHIGFRYNGTIVGFIGTNGTTAVTYSTTASDERLKKNIEDWQENILDKFEKIEPKEFNFISQEEGEGKTKGFIAQNMAEDFPEAYPHDYSEDKYYSFNPSGMVVYLMKAVKDLVEQNKQLETRIQTLEQQKQ